MDLGSHDKSLEETKDELGVSLEGNPDLYLCHGKCEQGEENFGHENETMNGIMQVDSNQDQSGSPVLPVGVNNEGLQSYIMKSNSSGSSSRSNITEESHLPAESDLDRGDVDRKILHYEIEGLRSPPEYNKREETQYIGLSNELLDSSPKVETENFNPCAHNHLLKFDDKSAHEVVDSEGAKYPTYNEPANGDSGDILGNTQFENTEFVTEERLLPSNIDIKAEGPPSFSKRKRSLSPVRHSVDRNRVSSRDRLSPSDRRTLRETHNRDNSPRKRLSTSPRRRESPHRRDRSTSRSPTRRKGSSGHRSDHHGRSRSRSPYSRDRYRRSSRHSPRHKSSPSGYSSRQRSPRRRWSPPANRNTGVGRPGKNLFVAGFSYVTTERDLEKKFSRFGRVTDVRVVRERRSGESRGFGFLSMEKDENADAAIRALDQTEWNSRLILVEKSKTSFR